MRRQTILKISALVCALLALPLGGSLWAQGPVLTWQAHITHSDPEASLKLLFSTIVDDLPTADVAHDHDTELLTIVTSAFIEESWLAAICSQAGFTLVSLRRGGEEEPEGPAGSATAPIEPQNQAHDE